MHYISVEGLGKSYGIKPLFENISFHIEESDKIAIVARNGSGKSTLLKILSGKETPDNGSVWVNKEVKIVLFEQESHFLEEQTSLENIFHLDHPIINAIKGYEAASETGDAAILADAIIKMDALNAWDFETKVKQILGRLNIHHLQQPVGTLSGGQRKRLALARTLIDVGFDNEHVLLIMDEPTNHLDVDMVEWLEGYLSQEKLTLVLVTHDRYFLDAICKEIWEIDRNTLVEYKGGYENFVEKKSARLENEIAGIDKAKNIYRKELEWMRKQPKARTTKSKSRQDNFYLIQAKAKQQIDDRQLELHVKLNRLGGKIAEMKKVYKSFGDKVILKGFDYTFKKGEKLGIIGKNGVGKSTFINVLQGAELPDSGKIVIGETVVFGNYSQEGLQINEDLRVIEFVKNIAEQFPLANGASLTASQFLQLFLFNADQQYTYISQLSGGEKRRLHLLSVLFRNPNFLILDEPTNDLDLPTIAVLENFLSEYQGCLIIVSHDRYFMNRLVDHLLVMEGNGKISDFPGNYSQYREQQKRVLEKQDLPTSKMLADQKNADVLSRSRAGDKKQLSYKEKREFELLESEIAELESEKMKISEKLHGEESSFEELQSLSIRLSELTILLDAKELRWLELSEIS